MPDVVFRPAVQRLAQDRQRAWFGAPEMTDHGDHVEYFDGKQTHRWRLPDQSSDYPLVATVLIAGFVIAVGSHVSHYRVNFLDQDDRLLGRLNFRDRVYAEHFAAVLPDDALAGLQRRGVRIERKTYRDGPAFHREYPDNISNPLQRAFQQHPAWWTSGGLILIVAVVNLVLLARGYYS